MEIPYTVRPRPDTGLANPKLGIWLFLASEVMLFGGLFAGYIFMRLGAEPWMWPHGWLNVPVGTFNTFILIFSSVTIILSWESLKMRKYKAYKGWLAATWLCGLSFLGVKLIVEWPEKFHHFGAYVRANALDKYEPLLGNQDHKHVEDGKEVVSQGLRTRNKPERRFISGHLSEEGFASPSAAMKHASIPYLSPKQLDDMLGSYASIQAKIPELATGLAAANEKLKTSEEALKAAKSKYDALPKGDTAETDLAATKAKQEVDAAAATVKATKETIRDLEHQKSVATRTEASMMLVFPHYGMEEADVKKLLAAGAPEAERTKLRKEFLAELNTIEIHEIDPYNATPYDPDNDGAHFVPRSRVEAAKLKNVKELEEAGLAHEHKTEKGETHTSIVIHKEDLENHHGAFLPKLNTYLACYFMITGLHGAHVLGGCIVFFYFWLNIKGGSKLYHTNHQQLCNRIEVAGLFWHLVDLIWIFVFPIFYLL